VHQEANDQIGQAGADFIGVSFGMHAVGANGYCGERFNFGAHDIRKQPSIPETK